jgi:molybdenum cofactor cytidylyltransferase
MELIDALRLTLTPGAPDVVALVGGGGKSSSAFRLAAEAAARGVRAVATTTTRIAAGEIYAAPAVVEVTGAALPLEELACALARSGWCLLVDAARGEKRTGIAPALVDGLAAAAPQLGLGLIGVEADGSRQLPVKAPAAHEPVIPASATLVVAVAGVDALGRELTPDQVHRPEHIRALLGLAPDALARLAPAQMARLLLHAQGGDQGRPSGTRRMLLINKVENAAQLALARLVAARAVAAGVTALIAAVGRSEVTPVRERWGPLGVVVLAAGQAQRMGSPKQLIAVDGTTMVRRAVTTALAAGAQQVVLVSGAHAAAVEAEIAPLVACRSELAVVHNPVWESGQASSMQAGLAALRPEIEAAIFVPVDQPHVPAALLRRLAQAWRTGAALAAPVVAAEMRGAPALFDRSLWPELMDVRGDVGGREVLRRHAARVRTIPAQAAWLRDVDTPDDLTR